MAADEDFCSDIFFMPLQAFLGDLLDLLVTFVALKIGRANKGSDGLEALAWLSIVVRSEKGEFESIGKQEDAKKRVVRNMKRITRSRLGLASVLTLL